VGVKTELPIRTVPGRGIVSVAAIVAVDEGAMPLTLLAYGTCISVGRGGMVGSAFVTVGSLRGAVVSDMAPT